MVNTHCKHTHFAHITHFIKIMQIIKNKFHNRGFIGKQYLFIILESLTEFPLYSGLCKVLGSYGDHSVTVSF